MSYDKFFQTACIAIAAANPSLSALEIAERAMDAWRAYKLALEMKP